MTNITELIPRISGAPVFQQMTPVYPKQSNQPHLTNEEVKIILKGCKLNQREAQRKLYRLFYSYAMSFALRYSANYDIAVELTNDTFLKIYREIRRSAWPKRSSEERLAEGLSWPPSSATRSPARSSKAATARTRSSARSDFSGRLGTDRQSIEAESSRHSHTLCAASHSVSRT